jgi:hypothetical protein
MLPCPARPLTQEIRALQEKDQLKIVLARNLQHSATGYPW